MNDVIQFDSLIRNTKKFDEILIISQETASGKVKDKLTSFINDRKGNSIDEVLFYFSGHGDFANDEFYYILSLLHFQQSREKKKINPSFRVLKKWLKLMQ